MGPAPPCTDWEMRDWPKTEVPSELVLKKAFLNLKANFVWKPDSIRYLRECHRAPDFT